MASHMAGFLAEIYAQWPNIAWFLQLTNTIYKFVIRLIDRSTKLEMLWNYVRNQSPE